MALSASTRMRLSKAQRTLGRNDVATGWSARAARSVLRFGADAELDDLRVPLSH